MSDPLIREMDNYVVLVPGESEQFLDKEQTLLWLQSWLNKFDSLPLDSKTLIFNFFAKSFSKLPNNLF